MEQVALITGASSTIGMAIAKKLGDSGISLVLHYHTNKEKINAFKIENPEFDIADISADLSTVSGIETLFKKIDNINKSPSIFIHAVGIADYALIQDVTYEKWNHLMNGMVMSAFFCSQKLIPTMIRNRFGRIITISSVWGQIGAANEVLYSTAKGAIDTFTKALAKELAPSGITVNGIAPGVVISPMMEGFSSTELADLRDEIPMHRFLEPKEIAHHVYHLIQPESAYVTGQIIRIDGGWI